MFTYLFVVVSLRAALVWHQCCLLPKAEPRPVSDHLSGVLCLWPTHAVQQALHGESRCCFPHIRDFSFLFSKLQHKHNNLTFTFDFLHSSMTGIRRRPQWCWMLSIVLQKVRIAHITNAAFYSLHIKCVFVCVLWQMALLVSTALSCLPSVGQLTVSVS